MSISSKIGIHVSIAGGIDLAPARARELGCETFQCFSRPPQGGKAVELTPALISKFKEAMRLADMQTFYIHAPYYINLASLDNRIRHASIRVLREELDRGNLLGAGYVMVHVGSHSGQTLEEGLTKVAEGICEILKDYSGSTLLLMEIAAGSGSVIGDTFEELSAIIQQLGLDTGPDLKHTTKLAGFGGICFDTCHAFASGYDYTTPAGLQQVLHQFDTIIGLDYLKLTHVNDSKTELNGKRDRHEHIGDGFIGKEGIARILTSPPFSKIDWLLETEESKRSEDIAKLKELRL